MSEVTVWGIKDTMTIPEQQGAVLKATFTVVNPEQISNCPSGTNPELDLDRVTFFKRNDGRYRLVQGNLEEVLAEAMDKLVANKTVTVSFGLDVRDCPQKERTPEMTKTSNSSSALGLSISRMNLKFLQNKIEQMRIKAVAKKTFNV